MSNEAQEQSEPISTHPETLSSVESNQVECQNLRVPETGCSNQGNDSLPVKFVTDAHLYKGIGPTPVTNYWQTQPQFSLNKPGPSRCFLPLEQPHHKPHVSITSAETHVLHSVQKNFPKPTGNVPSSSVSRCNETSDSAQQLTVPGGEAVVDPTKTAHFAGVMSKSCEGCSRVSHRGTDPTGFIGHKASDSYPAGTSSGG